MKQPVPVPTTEAHGSSPKGPHVYVAHGHDRKEYTFYSFKKHVQTKRCN